MLFDIKPKTTLRDLFNREKEKDELEKSLKLKNPIIVVLGIRRIGKTSLLRAFLSDKKVEYAWIDLRRSLTENQSIDLIDLTNQFEKELNKLLPKTKKVRKKLEKIESITLPGLTVKFNKAMNQSSLVQILEILNETGENTIIVFDEAQYLEYLRSINMLNVISYAYDNLENITFILTGSEVGLLEDFLKIDKPDSPLYGRYVKYITLERFSREQSIKFLESGFKEVNLKPSIEHLEKVVDAIDGIVGWLTLYGYSAYTSNNPNYPIEKFVQDAIAMVEKELKELLRRSRYYRLILKAIALGNKNWSTIKEYVEFKLKKEVNDAILDRYLKKLIKMSIINKTYKGRRSYYNFQDHLIEEYAKKL